MALFELWWETQLSSRFDRDLWAPDLVHGVKPLFSSLEESTQNCFLGAAGTKASWRYGQGNLLIFLELQQEVWDPSPGTVGNSGSL